MTSVQLKALVRPISKLFKTKSGFVKDKMKTCELGKLKTLQREYRYLKMTILQLALVQPISKLFITEKKLQKTGKSGKLKTLQRKVAWWTLSQKSSKQI